MSDYVSTGMMRAVDEMGRLVLPKGVRSMLQISGGDSVEFFSGSEGAVLMKKVSHTSFMPYEASACLRGLQHMKGAPCVVCNLNSVVAVGSEEMNGLVGSPIIAGTYEVLSRGIYHHIPDSDLMLVDKHAETAVDCSAPLYAGGLHCGAVVILRNGNTSFKFNDEKEICVQLIASILSNWNAE